MVAASLITLMMVAALAIDVGVLYTSRTSAQTAADAAALAGAYTFANPCNYPAGGAPPAGCVTTHTYTAAAQQAAVTLAAQNGILGQQVAITNADVTVDEANRLVTVTVPRTGAGGINTYFAGIMGWNKVDVVAVATAQGVTSGSATRVFKPIYLPNTIMSDPATETPATACAAGHVIFDTAGRTNAPYPLSTWAQQQFAAGAVCRTVRPTTANEANGNLALAPSQFLSIDVGSGASTYRCAWSTPLNQCANANVSLIQCDQPYPVGTGNEVGPTRQGVLDMIDPNPHDTWGGIGTYYLGGDTSQPSATSRSLGMAPVWNNCPNLGGVAINSGTNGQTVKVVGFVEFFVDGVGTQSQSACGGGGGGGGGGGAGNSYVKAHFIQPISCGAQTAGGGGANTGPFGLPIRLVQTPGQ